MTTAAPETYYTNGADYDMTKGDIYSIGSTLLALLLGHFPFDTSFVKYNIDEIKELSRSGRQDNFDDDEVTILLRRDINVVNNIIQGFNGHLRNLLRSTLQPDPSQRITWPDLINHPWFN